MRKIVMLTSLIGRMNGRWSIILLVGVGIALLVWLIKNGTMRVQWEEEVELSNGTVVTVTQQRTFVKVSYELFQSGWETRYNKIVFPDGVSFEAADRIALLYLDRGNPPVKWVLIASPLFCEEFNKYGRPRPDYIQFEYINGGWTYRAVQPEYLGRHINLNVNDRQVVSTKRDRVTIQAKKIWNTRTEGIGWTYLSIRADSNADVCSNTNFKKEN